MQESIKETLEFFVEKAEKLRDSSFMESMNRHGGRLTIFHKIGEPLVFNVMLPKQDSIESFVLTIRFFTLKNEPTSFRAMANKLLDDDEISESLKQAIKTTRDKVNTFLDEPSFFNLNYENISHREVLETVMYGGLVHNNSVD